MRSLSILILFVLAATLSVCAAAAQGHAVSICIPSNPFPPLTFPDHEGQAQWLARKAIARMGDSASFAVVPWARCVEGMRAGTYDGALPPTLAFANEFAFPLGDDGKPDARKSVGEVTMVVLRRVGSAADWDGTAFTGLASPVMFNKGVLSVREKLARLGVRGDEGARSNDMLIHKLVAGRADLLVMNYQVAVGELALPEFRGKLTILPAPFLSMVSYLAFGQRYLAAHPGYAEAVWNEIARLRATPEWARVAPTRAK